MNTTSIANPAVDDKLYYLAKPPSPMSLEEEGRLLRICYYYHY
jgi:hypothetical protein